VYGVPSAEAQIDPRVVHEIDEAHQAVVAEQNLQPAGWIDCFRPANKTLYRTILGMMLQSLQQLTGAK
jgi:SP family sugar:H+ symporter-like MFS transporter